MHAPHENKVDSKTWKAVLTLHCRHIRLALLPGCPIGTAPPGGDRPASLQAAALFSFRLPLGPTGCIRIDASYWRTPLSYFVAFWYTPPPFLPEPLWCAFFSGYFVAMGVQEFTVLSHSY